MWDEGKIKEYLKINLKPKRYKHVMGVRDTAYKLAIIHNGDSNKAILGALIHDCAKNKSNEEIIEIVKNSSYLLEDGDFMAPELLHGLAGAIIAKELMGIEDEEVLNSSIYHTTGRSNMTLLEKIIYIADYIEPNRDFPGVEDLREATFNNLDEGLLKAFNNTIKYVVEKGGILHKRTVEARDYLLKEIQNKNSRNK